jgi:hypothetical protein
MQKRAKVRVSRWFVAYALAGIPLVAWLARARKRENRANQDAFAPDSAEDFTSEQTAFLARVREICDTKVAV